MESMRGTRLGALSYERDEHVGPAERRGVRYVCAEGHVSIIPFSTEAEEIPHTWTCRCGAEATSPDVVKPEAGTERHQRTHWDMLLERRSREDLEALLEERLTLLRQGVLPRSA
jgi:hypothetical protein